MTEKKRGNIKNLRVPTSEQAREFGRKGGLASAAARKERMSLRQTLEAMLELEVDPELGLPKGMTFRQAITFGQLKAAAGGNPSAFRELTTLLGERIEKQEVSTTDELMEVLTDARARGSEH